MPKMLKLFLLTGIGVIVAAFAVGLTPDANCGSWFSPNPAGGVTSAGNECASWVDTRGLIFWILIVVGITDIALGFFFASKARRREEMVTAT